LLLEPGYVFLFKKRGFELAFGQFLLQGKGTFFAEPAPRGSSYLNPCFSPAGPGIFPSALPGRELCGDSPDNLGGGRFKSPEELPEVRPVGGFIGPGH
jgi:hypothetical protein